MLRRHVLACAIVSVLLASCASGGGSQGGGDDGGGGVIVSPDAQPPAGHPEWSYARNTINLDPAQQRYTGRGVVVGMFDTLPNLNYAPLQGRGHGSDPRISDGQPGNVTDDGSNHGTAVATVMVGGAWGAWRGGVAPNATLLFTNRSSPFNIRQMTDRGMTVFNQSVQSEFTVGSGSDAAQRDYLRASGLLDAYRYLRDRGGIVVHAAGNAGAANPSTSGAVPYYFPDITNWVTVVGLDSLGRNLASFSNQCGVMAQQCLAAPGTWRLVWPTPGQPAGFSYRWTGTSFAAPAVSGVAALVKEAFPWMNGTQLAQTLLTTARDLGATGVDPVYGWGVVDAGRAVQGPAQLTSNWNVAVPAGMASVFGNDINGVGGLWLGGQGTLTLAGDNTYAGGTHLQSGGLRINGALSGDVNQSGGALGGNGRIGGDLLQTGGALDLWSHQTLTVAGTARLAGTAWLRPGAGFTGRWEGVVLQAAQIEGHLALRDDALFYSSALERQGNAWVGTVDRRSGAAALQALGLGDATTVRAAASLDRVFADRDASGQATATEANVLGVANALRRDATAAASLDSVAGQAHATARGMAVSTAEMQQHWASDRVRAAAHSSNGGAWAMAGHQETQVRPADAFDAVVRSDSWTAGADRRVSEDWLVGAAVQKGRTRSQFDRNGGRVDTEQVGAMAYGAWTPNDQWAVSAHAGVSMLDNDVERQIVLAGAAPVTSNTDATLLSVGLKADRRIGTHWGVTGQLTYDRLRSHGFEEAGSTGFELVADASTASNATAGLGVLFFDGKPVESVGWRWSGEALYLRSVEAPDTGFRARYSGLAGTWFKVDGMDVGRDAAWLSGKLAYRFGRSNQIDLDAYLRSHRHGNDTAVTVSYRQEF